MKKIDYRLIESPQNNPYRNLAAETVMTDSPANLCYFYLWTNAPTIVIGYNQNPFSECNLDAAANAGVFIARRRTGGGAVYHDFGNLNFSFVMPEEIYDVKRQSSVIVNALKSLGINAELTGRNDITACGRKFSGNAFYKGKTHRLHHGTLMIDVDFGALSSYLTPDPSKYLKKGVSSVKARVVNLKELAPTITAEALKNALKTAFCKEYGCFSALNCAGTVENESPAPTENDFFKKEEVLSLAQKIGSDEYLYGKWRDFKCDKSADFSWGKVKTHVESSGGKVSKVVFSTDGLFPSAVAFAEEYFSAYNVERDLTAAETAKSAAKSAPELATSKSKIQFPSDFTVDDEKVFYDLKNLIEQE